MFQGLLGLLFYHTGVITAGVDCINKPLGPEFALWHAGVSALLPVFHKYGDFVLGFDYLEHQLSPPPAPLSSHPPLLSLYPLFHGVSIPMCKGHPGYREAAVDREINKQKKRERSDGGQSPVIHRVNYRPAPHKHTPKPAGARRSATSAPCFALLLCLWMCFSCAYLPCFVAVLSLWFFLSLSLCALSSPPLASLCSLCLPVTRATSPPPSLPLSRLENTQATGGVETFLDRGVTLC